jgi:integrase
MTKRGNGEGSVYRRGTGQWVAVLTLRNGKRKFLYAKTRQEAVRRLNVAIKGRDEGTPTATRLTVAAFLVQWLDVARHEVRPSTFRRYQDYVHLHAIPEIGKVQLAQLCPAHLQRLYGARLAVGLSPTTVAHLHTVLHRAFGQAVRWGLLPRNVSDLVDAPRTVRHEMQTLDADQAKAFLAELASDRLHALFVLAITTGMRQGELFGLQWRSVDLVAGTIGVRASLSRATGTAVVSETKTDRSRRQIALTPLAIKALTRHRVAQAKERLLVGGAWDDNDLVFCNEIGRPLHPSNVTHRTFRPALLRAGCPQIRFHDLRHTCATLLLGKGVHPKVVAEMLGHSQIAVTLDTYSHVTPSMQQAAVTALEGLLGDDPAPRAPSAEEPAREPESGLLEGEEDLLDPPSLSG